MSNFAPSPSFPSSLSPPGRNRLGPPTSSSDPPQSRANTIRNENPVHRHRAKSMPVTVSKHCLCAQAPVDVRPELIRDIRGFYREAIARTPVYEVPALVLAAAEGGLCFGPLDPVSNIIANTVSHLLPPSERASDVATVESLNVRSRVWAKEMAGRSLDALVAFLICYFRYLHNWQAMHYLSSAKGDLFAAVQLIQADRCITDGFDICSRTAKAALRCAALAAGHSSPDCFVTATLALTSQAREVSQLLSSSPGHLSAAIIEQLRSIVLRGNPKYINQPDLMALTVSRLPPRSKSPDAVKKDEAMVDSCTESLRRILLDKIHGFYLEALALLPRDKLRRRYHRSLVKAGHLYGPLDPVSNIVLNTIWYDAAYPGPEEQDVELEMVGRWGLIRAERCSLAGLVSGLSAFVGGDFSEHDAICYLLYANADFHAAMELVQQIYFERRPLQPSDLYRTMANAALHPSPEALQEFITSERAHAMLPVSVDRLSPKDVQWIIRSLSQEPPSIDRSLEMFPLPPLNEQLESIFAANKESFFADNNAFYRKVKAALDDYVLAHGGAEFVIHAICGANERVADRCGPEYSVIDYPRSHVKFHYSHFNFLASPAGLSSCDVVPTLFFAECVNYDEESDKSRKTTCCPVVVPTADADKGRCFYCEYRGTAIIHPVDMDFHWGDVDFEKMVQGKHPLANCHIIYNGNRIADSMSVKEEDFVYFDPKRDHNLIKAVKAGMDTKMLS